MRIGIVTLYYKSINYGGNLQAYALCKFLQKNGYDAEQICFTTNLSNKESLFEKIKRILKLGLGRVVSLLKKRVTPHKGVKENQSSELFEKAYKEMIKEKRASFEHFNQEIIPHSSNVYYADNITDCLSNYDAFITGSDQVWNFKTYHPIYFLDFVPESKLKMSYAASFSMDKLEKWQQKVVNKSLKTFKAISVREEDALDFIKTINKPKAAVLDPTLLLDTQDWDKVCAEKCVDCQYVFCYFLGDNPKERVLAEQFAKNKGLKLVSVPHSSGAMKETDFSFGDIRFHNSSPEQFISLIKYANYVFTDSFHATVFSNLYKKEYFVFNRNEKKEMASRIINLTGLYGTENRYCVDDKENLDYILSLETIDYDKNKEKISKLKEDSKNFLLSNLGV